MPDRETRALRELAVHLDVYARKYGIELPKSRSLAKSAHRDAWLVVQELTSVMACATEADRTNIVHMVGALSVDTIENRHPTENRYSVWLE